MANWFIASEPDNALLVALHQALLDFMNSRAFANQNTAFGRYADRQTHADPEDDTWRTTLWLSPALQTVLRAYPNYFFHYIFHKLILAGPICARSGSKCRRSRRGRSHAIAGICSPGAAMRMRRSASCRKKLPKPRKKPRAKSGSVKDSLRLYPRAANR